jgi:hypothetical protein
VEKIDWQELLQNGEPDEVMSAKKSEEIFIEVNPSQQEMADEPIEIHDCFGFVFTNAPGKKAWISLEEPQVPDESEFTIICETSTGRMFKGSIYAAAARGYLEVKKGKV